MTGRSASTRLQPLLDALAEDVEGPRVVAIGGGHGLARALRAIRSYAGHITAIVSVADDGGSSGRLAPALDIPPPGDIRRALLALTPDRSPMRRAFGFRFEDGDVAGHALGNLILAALADLEGDFVAALRVAEGILGTVGSVLPAAAHRLTLEAVVDGRVVEGQVAIAQGRGRISKIRLVPEDAVATPEAVDAIASADQIVLGPGSLYTSTMAALLVPGIVEAINAGGATLVYVLNLITQDGETLHLDAADHLAALLETSGLRPPSTMVANSAPVEVAQPLEVLGADPDVIATFGVDVAFGNLVAPEAEWPAHDVYRLGRLLATLT